MSCGTRAAAGAPPCLPAVSARRCRAPATTRPSSTPASTSHPSSAHLGLKRARNVCAVGRACRA
eukprot:4446105-Pleurochrysis_carterae.AAC.3